MGGSTARRDSSKSSGGSYGGGERDRNQQQQVVNKVAAKTAASNAKKQAEASGNTMYGGAVSKAVDDALVKKGNVKVGSYFKKVGGDFIRLGNKEGERLYAAGDPSVSRSVIGNKESAAMKYGVSGSAMGSGDPTGAMTSTPISKDMLRSQNKAKALMTGALSFGMPGIGATAMRVAAAESAADYANPEAAYEDYMEGFQAKMQGKKYTKKRSAQSFAGKVIDNIKTTILGGDGSKLGD